MSDNVEMKNKFWESKLKPLVEEEIEEDFCQVSLKKSFLQKKIIFFVVAMEANVTLRRVHYGQQGRLLQLKIVDRCLLTLQS